MKDHVDKSLEIVTRIQVTEVWLKLNLQNLEDS
jgi:hypothetical protein